MKHTPFEYGGLHFIPERQFEPQGQYHRRIPLSRMGQEAEANLFLGKFAYSHSGFYEVSMETAGPVSVCAGVRAS